MGLSVTPSTNQTVRFSLSISAPVRGSSEGFGERDLNYPAAFIARDGSSHSCGEREIRCCEIGKVSLITQLLSAIGFHDLECHKLCQYLCEGNWPSYIHK